MKDIYHLLKLIFHASGLFLPFNPVARNIFTYFFVKGIFSEQTHNDANRYKNDGKHQKDYYGGVHLAHEVAEFYPYPVKRHEKKRQDKTYNPEKSGGIERPYAYVVTFDKRKKRNDKKKTCPNERKVPKFFFQNTLLIFDLNSQSVMCQAQRTYPYIYQNLILSVSSFSFRRTLSS
jgi:hypothetical protein